ncbi:MAG TPA: adenylate/guanylate cyclase domain-containing protein [Exilispira sp.]|nr:adenylate/guanylate cyclase domain-containing protein [Exilispira sp.]
MHDIAGVSALKIDPEKHKVLMTREDEKREEYIEIKNYLKEIRNINPDIRFVYTYRLNSNGQIEFVVDSEDGIDASHIGEIYDEYTNEMIDVLYKPYKINTDKEFTVDKWGSWLSSYAPIVDSNGNIIAAIGIDVDAKKVIEYENKYLLTIMFSSILVSIFVLILGLIIAKMISTPLSELTSIIKMIEKLKLDNQKAVISNIKEITEISESVDNMKKALKSFRKYVPADLVNELMSMHKEAILSVEKKELTICFTDIENFTTISEKTDLEILVEKLDEYFDGMTRILQDNYATIDKFIGDSIMSFWNSPKRLDNHTFLACKAALECLKFNLELNERFNKVGFPSLNTRFGINTGEAIVGNIGYQERLNYTIIGDNVNLASRLEGLNKYYETRIIISENVYNVIKEDFEVRLLDNVIVKGKTYPIKIYELIDFKNCYGKYNKEFLQIYSEGVNYFYEKKWNEALSTFDEILKKYGFDKPSSIFYERCQKYIKNPPLDDNDIYTKMNRR